MNVCWDWRLGWAVLSQVGRPAKICWTSTLAMSAWCRGWLRRRRWFRCWCPLAASYRWLATSWCRPRSAAVVVFGCALFSGFCLCDWFTGWKASQTVTGVTVTDFLSESVQNKQICCCCCCCCFCCNIFVLLLDGTVLHLYLSLIHIWRCRRRG